MKKKAFIVFSIILLSSTKAFAQPMPLDEGINTTVLKLGQRISKIPGASFRDEQIEGTISEIRQELTDRTEIEALNLSSTLEELYAYVIDELNNTAEPIINFGVDLGGGKVIGFELEFILQAGASVGVFNFLLDASGGFGTRNDIPKGNCHFGGIIGIQLFDIFLLGLGGGFAGGTETDEINPGYLNPYLRGLVSVIFDIDDVSIGIGLYCDYNFDIGSKVGFRYYVNILQL